MLIFLKNHSTREHADRVIRAAAGFGYDAELLPPEAGGSTSASPWLIRLSSEPEPAHSALLRELDGVEAVLPVSRPVRHVHRTPSRTDTVIRVGSRKIGGGGFTLVAGPCAVENEAQILAAARAVRDAGADFLRGGAYKPRTSPYDFQGLGGEGLELLALAREKTGLPVITEVVDEASLALVEQYGDVIQIGARNMQNFALLKRVGRSTLPVLLKRGMSANLEDWLLSAEYLLDAGNSDVILCERGIRTFSNHSRYTLDLSVVPVLKRLTHLPVFVDPSHASGNRQSVAPLARAALAAGADGVMVEVHPEPDRALCDGPQSVPAGEFAALASGLRALASLLAREREAVS